MGQARERGHRLALIALAAALAACQPAPGDDAASTACLPGVPDAGQVVVAPLACGAMRIPGGEGRGSDVWIGNHWFRAVIRHPQSALGVPGVGGGTLIDAAPWGHADRLHEAIPVVGGGWLDVDGFEVAPDRVVVSGHLAPLPFGPPVDGSVRAVVSWVPDPDGPWLRLEGADGLWLRPAGGLELLDGMLVGDLTYGHDGALVEDLGGAIRVEGATGLLVAPSATAPQEWAPATRAIAGTLDGVDQIVLARGEEIVGRLPVEGEGFDLLVQADVDAVRAEAAGRAPGPWTPPGLDLALRPGPRGRLALTVALDRPGLVRVEWADQGGRSGVEALRSRDGRLDLGAGTYDLVVSAGPEWAPVSRTVVVRPETTTEVRIAPEARLDPGSRVLADLAVAGSRSWTWRGTDAAALRAYASDGRGFVVVAPEDDVSLATTDEYTAERLRWRNGVRLRSRRGFSIVAWPWAATASAGGHGAVDMADLSALDALAAARGGPGTSRFTVVDGAWLDQAGPPWTVAPRPDLVRVDAPGPFGPAGGAWDPWFAWLDAGVALVPTGPLVWVDVDDPAAFAGVDVEQALARGNVVATTGGLVALDVNGVGPGEVVPRTRVPGAEPERRYATVRVDSAGAAFVRASLVRDGVTIAEWDPEQEPAVRIAVAGGEGWIVAAAWSADGQDFAVTGPVWLGPR